MLQVGAWRQLFRRGELTIGGQVRLKEEGWKRAW